MECFYNIFLNIPRLSGLFIIKEKATSKLKKKPFFCIFLSSVENISAKFCIEIRKIFEIIAIFASTFQNSGNGILC